MSIAPGANAASKWREIALRSASGPSAAQAS
jgi:hypothetical protein